MESKIIFVVKCIMSVIIGGFYIFRMINNVNFYIKSKIDFSKIKKAMIQNNEEGKKTKGSFDSPDSDLNKWQVNNDENKQKAAALISEKIKDMFYDTVYACGVFGVIWLNFGTSF